MENKISKAILKAENNYGAIHVNFKNGHLLSAVTFSYFTYFWLVKALLFKKDVYDETYHGIRGKFRELYFDTNLIPSKYLIIWSELTNNRYEADYEVKCNFTKEEVQEMITWTEEFLAFVKENIDKL
jgi:uncharacterized protein (UPF0332 family)